MVLGPAQKPALGRCFYPAFVEKSWAKLSSGQFAHGLPPQSTCWVPKETELMADTPETAAEVCRLLTSMGPDWWSRCDGQSRCIGLSARVKPAFEIPVVCCWAWWQGRCSRDATALQGRADPWSLAFSDY